MWPRRPGRATYDGDRVRPFDTSPEDRMTLPADRPVVLVAEELAPSALEVLADDFDVRHVDGTDRGALLSALASAHAVIVRSATQIDAEAIAAAPSLKVVARAGVGLDNVE